MMTFKEMMHYLEEVKVKNKDNTNHSNGTYIAANVSPSSQKALDEWVTKHKIPNPSEPKEYHTTVIYSRKGIPDVMNDKIDTPLSGKIIGWKIFGTQVGVKCLVASVECDELDDQHNRIRAEYGATHDFPEYQPHITVSYNYGDGAVPKEIPTFPIVFNKITMKALDPDFVPPTKKA
jgi:2'-5' RNA ligase